MYRQFNIQQFYVLPTRWFSSATYQDSSSIQATTAPFQVRYSPQIIERFEASCFPVTAP